MSQFVLDSSVMAKWVLPETDTPKAEKLVSDAALKGDQMISLDLAFVEVANAIWKQFHRGLATSDQTRKALDDFLQNPVHAEPANRLLKPALDIAVKYDCAVYDALFVALCQDLGLQGVTADEPLYKAVHPDYPNIILLRNW